MWLASEMAAFAHVAELGSFTAAARALQAPKVAVSRAVASLERRLRSRRPATGTPLAGRTRLRVLVDAGYGRLLVTPLVPRFLEHYDAIELQVALTDTLPDEAD